VTPRALGGAAAGLALLAFLAYQGRPLDVKEHEATTRRLRQASTLSEALQKDVLRLRQGEIASYDPLDSEIAALREIHRALSSPPRFLGPDAKADLAARVADSAALLQSTSEAVETFKSKNAVLRNSLAYLAAMGPETTGALAGSADGQRLAEELNRLLRDVLSYSLTSREALAPACQSRVDALRGEGQMPGGVSRRDVDLLLDHVVKTLQTKPPLDAAVERILSPAATSKVEGLHRSYEAAHDTAQRRVQRYRAALFGAALLGVSLGGLLVIRRLSRDAAALRRLNDEKNEFLGIAAHDLKNPLSTISGYTSLLLEDEEMDAAERREVHKKVLLASQRMILLIKNLLDVNAIEQGEVKLHVIALDLAALARDVHESFREKAAKKSQPLRLEGDRFLPVRADRDALIHVLDNLVSNAVKYSPSGKPIVVTLSQGPLGGRCAVKDEGPGLSAEDQRKLFGKFARLSARPTGGEHSTGLGLSIVKRMVEAMGGKVWCESALGAGSTFGVDLPEANPAELAATSPEDAPARSSRWASVEE